MKRILLLGLLLFPAESIFSATWISDGSQGSVQALHDQSATVSGDTITIPTGTFAWGTSSTLTITKGITLRGGTTGNQEFGVSSDQTKIQAFNVGRSMLTLGSAPAGTVIRVTQITFIPGQTTTQNGRRDRNDNFTGDSDTANGTWSSQLNFSAGTGAVGMSITSQYKTVSASAAQTYNPTFTSANTMVGWIEIAPTTVAGASNKGFFMLVP